MGKQVYAVGIVTKGLLLTGTGASGGFFKGKTLGA